jgi:hypothetical protein
VTNLDRGGLVPPDPAPVPDDLPPPRRRRAGWWVLAGVMVLAVVATAISFLLTPGAAQPGEAPDSTRTAQAAPATAMLGGPKTVVYVVQSSGRADLGSIEYTDADGDIIRHSGIPLPWRLTFTVTGDRPPLVLIAQRKDGDDGAVTCSITYDDKILATATQTGRYAAPQCST